MRGAMRKYYIAIAVIAAVCASAIVWQYTLSRGAASDEQKISDIVQVQSALDSYTSERGEAPDNLRDLGLDGKLQSRLGDYEYSKNTDSYTVCATFKTDASLPSSSYSSLEGDPYYHKKGRQCFTSDIYSYDFNDYDFDSPSTPPSNPYDTETFNFDSLYQ